MLRVPDWRWVVGVDEPDAVDAGEQRPGTPAKGGTTRPVAVEQGADLGCDAVDVGMAVVDTDLEQTAFQSRSRQVPSAGGSPGAPNTAPVESEGPR